MAQNNDLFKHKENGNTYEVIKIFNEYGMNMIMYKEYSFPSSEKPRMYCRDLYMFLKNMEIVK